MRSLYIARTMHLQRFLILFVLLAGAFWLSFSPGRDTEDLPDAAEATIPAVETERSELAERSTVRPVGRSDTPAISEDRKRFTDSIVVGLDRFRSQNLQQAVDSEVTQGFSEFISLLEASDDEQQIIQTALAEAYIEIRLVASAMEQGMLSEADISALSNPNYILDVMSEVLDANQLTALEEAMEQRARRDFDLSHAAEGQSAFQGLSAASRELLLETYFSETYALTSPDGMALTAGPSDTLDRRLDAVQVTRTSLSGRFSAREAELIEEYLAQQEQAIAAAAILFDR